MNRARAKRIQTLENIKKNIDSNKGEMKKKKFLQLHEYSTCLLKLFKEEE